MTARVERRLPPVFGELRPSQIITTFGPGAVVDLPNVSVIVAGTDIWTTSPDQELDEPRLKSFLRVRKLYRPATRTDGGYAGVPAYLFPRYLRCPRCKRIGAYDRRDLFVFDERSRKFRCRGSHAGRTQRLGPLVFPARFVVACSDGHLADFPWLEYVHRGRNASSCQPERLTLRESARSAAISELIVACDACDAYRSMEDAFGARADRALGPCRGSRPWLGHGSDEQCTEGRVRTTLRGASNLYFSVVHSALSIPEWDEPVHAAIASYEEQLTRIISIDALQAAMQLGVFPRLQNYDVSVVFAALERRRAQLNSRPTMSDIRREEFGALTGIPVAARAAACDFELEPSEVPPVFSGLIHHLRIVRRLREVRALSGFTRIDSPNYEISEQGDESLEVGIQTLSAAPVSWRPAVELRGEGIFVALKEDAVRRWEALQSVRARSNAMREIHRAWREARELDESPFPGSRYVLLHTLAHMLIQALALDCGYSSSSIRERIYSSDDAAGPMAGFLLYTATPDSDGSLGGLADKGRSGQFEPLLRGALERALYCSSDPLCGHSAPGEMGDLNGAACHACLMVSETACERGNRYLDRAHVIETIAELDTQYFGR